MFSLFFKGGPIMWPILGLSVVTFGVVFERLLFVVNEQKNKDRNAVHRVFELVEHDQYDDAQREGEQSKDKVARILAQGLAHRKNSLNDALLEAARQELDRYNRGLVILDTAVTLGPLLGLLGTVTGMIRAFGIVGSTSLADKQFAITGGISEALIAVSFGLCVAIVAILPLNYFSARLERERRIMEAAINQLTLILSRKET